MQVLPVPDLGRVSGRGWKGVPNVGREDFARTRLNQIQLRHIPEVLVSGAQSKATLQDKRCDPKIVRRNGRPLLPQLAKKARVVSGGRVTRDQNFHPRFHQKALEDRLVLTPSPAQSETGSELGDYDQRNVHAGGMFE